MPRKFHFLLGMAFMLTVSCSKGQMSEPHGCGQPLIEGTQLCLTVEESDALALHRDPIQALTLEGLISIRKHMAIDNLEIVIRDAPQQSIPEIGLGGYNPGPNRVIIFIDPMFENLPMALENELVYQLAHEIHHAKRRRFVGYGSSLLEAVVSEGLADHFAMEVTGKSAPLWARALDAEDLQSWLEQAKSEWNKDPYDHSRWFFGTEEVPRWTGYSIGFALVRQYLQDHPEARAATLYDRKARHFKP